MSNPFPSMAVPGTVSSIQLGKAIGHYVTCDDAVCVECDAEPECWDEWEEAVAIFSDSESDTPTHCTDCGQIIGHNLTPEGYQYVREAMADPNAVVAGWGLFYLHDEIVETRGLDGWWANEYAEIIVAQPNEDGYRWELVPVRGQNLSKETRAAALAERTPDE